MSMSNPSLNQGKRKKMKNVQKCNSEKKENGTCQGKEKMKLKEEEG